MIYGSQMHYLVVTVSVSADLYLLMIENVVPNGQIKVIDDDRFIGDRSVSFSKMEDHDVFVLGNDIDFQPSYIRLFTVFYVSSPCYVRC